MRVLRFATYGVDGQGEIRKNVKRRKYEGESQEEASERGKEGRSAVEVTYGAYLTDRSMQLYCH